MTPRSYLELIFSIFLCDSILIGMSFIVRELARSITAPEGIVVVKVNTSAFPSFISVTESVYDPKLTFSRVL